MAYDPPIVVYDANVLYPFHLRNLLIQCAVDRLVAARWTDEINEEWIRNLTTNVATLDRDRLLRPRALMNRALPEANVTSGSLALGCAILGSLGWRGDPCHGVRRIRCA